jgi:cytochrome c
MNDLNFNKIFAALLVAGITASLSGFVASKVFHHEKLEKNAYQIEGVVSAEGGAPAAAAKPEPILDLIASADVAQGQKIAKVCASCHSFDKGGPNGMGPDLYGIVGRGKGSHEGFAYSDSMKQKGGNWDYEDLNHFLWKPKSYVEGTKMTFAGLKKPEERAAVIAWLRTLSDSPKAAPSAADIEAEKADLAPAEAEAKPLDGKDATSAVPEGNAGTGAPQSSDSVKQGTKPEEGTPRTPTENTNDKIGGDQKTTQSADDKAKADKSVTVPEDVKIVPADKRDVSESTGDNDDKRVKEKGK